MAHIFQVVYVRRSGADVTLSYHSGEWAALALQGPKAREAEWLVLLNHGALELVGRSDQM